MQIGDGELKKKCGVGVIGKQRITKMFKYGTGTVRWEMV
jgi:hypothetical protein